MVAMPADAMDANARKVREQIVLTRADLASLK
jgi:hypothetical protein